MLTNFKMFYKNKMNSNKYYILYNNRLTNNIGSLNDTINDILKEYKTKNMVSKFHELVDDFIMTENGSPLKYFETQVDKNIIEGPKFDKEDKSSFEDLDNNVQKDFINNVHVFNLYKSLNDYQKYDKIRSNESKAVIKCINIHKNLLKFFYTIDSISIGGPLYLFLHLVTTNNNIDDVTKLYVKYFRSKKLGYNTLKTYKYKFLKVDKNIKGPNIINSTKLTNTNPKKTCSNNIDLKYSDGHSIVNDITIQKKTYVNMTQQVPDIETKFSERPDNMTNLTSLYDNLLFLFKFQII